MRIIIDTVIDNDDLPVINPAAGLLSPTLLAGYKMLSNQDFSGNGNHFTWSGSFDGVGAVLASDASHIITTPVMERDNMTVIICQEIPSSSPPASILNNLNLSGNPYQGVRLTKSGAAGLTNGQFDVAKNTNSITSVNVDINNGWMIKAYTWNNSNLRIIQHAGGYTDFALTSRTKGTSNPFRLNGIPSNIGGGSITSGAASGHLGTVLFYNEYMDVSKAVVYMDIVSQIMAARGVTGL
ncbi:hypothetical protein ACSFC0_27005 [Serratia marcescens]|uniref:hypothetical protein n=1 Tax=Serratia marcescens TaxID=615 RepID=UPI003ED9B566